ncbi:MAG: FAD-dependent oxidoreductase, partial [Roseovarius sp.]|nr:FAD-dependent oxidoreductase [Roseovarius sp.]
MKSDTPLLDTRDRVLVVGAGIAGLAAALRLAHAGLAVTVLERHAGPGGKMRAFPSDAGPVDAGPTVLTMRGVFDALFASVGTRLEDHIDLVPQDILARHFWPDGSRLDLFADEARSRAAIHDFAGDRAARQFTRFCARARRLFAAFDAPMMQAAAPSSLALAATVARQPNLIPAMAPLSTLAQSLARQFDDPRLRQLFGRYATYVGG